MGFLSLFGFGAKETAHAFKEVADGIGGLAVKIREAITGDISLEKKAEIEKLIIQLENQSKQLQMQINLAEAKSPKLFVAGWRPFIGWCCGFAICWNYIIHPLFCWIITFARLDVTPPPVMDLSVMMPVLFGMLGLAGYRTYEKTKDVHNKH